MKFDVQHAGMDPAWTPGIFTPSAVAGFARAAEECGYTSIGFTDHAAPTSNWVNNGGEGSIDPFSALGFCAGVTSNIQLLTWVLVLGYRNPFLTAHQTSSLDALSGGRLVVGVGAGYLKGEFKALGVDFDHRREAFDEALELMRAYWAGTEITGAGIGYDTRGTSPQPPPARPGGPPVWIHGNSRWGRERAARSADGWIAIFGAGPLSRTMRTAPIPDLDDLAAKIDDLRVLVGEAGRPEGSVEVVVSGLWPMLDIRKGWDSAQLQDQAAELAARGVDRLAVVIAGDDPVAAEETLRAAGAEFIPAVAAQSVDSSS